MIKTLKILIAILVVAILSVPIGILVMDKLAPNDKIYEGVTINGTPVGNLTKEQAVQLLDKDYNKGLQNKKIEVSYKEKDFSYVIEYKDLNARYDLDLAAKSAMEYGKDGNAFTRVFTKIALKNKPVNIQLKFLADDSRIKDDVKTIAKKIDEKAKNAKISYNGSFVVTEGKNGLKVDQTKLEAELKKSINPENKEEKVEVPVTVEKPKITADALRQINTKLASFSTSFNAGNANRVGNIRVSADSINGTVVMPGEVFSTNEAMGPRVKSSGYSEAPTIVNGTLTPGLGGGVCQVSSTLYNAALQADLEIVERRAHSMRVSYLPASRDAVISGDYIDLKFKNNTGYPIYVGGYPSGTSVTMVIYGSSKVPKKSVSIESTINSTKNLSDGKVQTKSSAYRKVYDSTGKLIRQEKLSNDTYKG